MSSNSTNQKFRPAFTKQEIMYLIDLLNRDKRDSVVEMAFTIASRLKIFALKADLGIVAPAFSSSEKQSLSEKLGMDEETPLQKRAAAYQKWTEVPSACTDRELELAMTYRYEHGLLTKEQEEAYEQS